MPNQRRVFMVAEKIRDLVAMKLNSVADPRFSLVTITSAVVSPDLRQAKVYWTVSGGQERVAEIEQAFANAEGLFRRTLSGELGTRFVPQIRFYYDNTLDTIDQIEDLFKRIHEEKAVDPLSETGQSSEDQEEPDK